MLVPAGRVGGRLAGPWVWTGRADWSLRGVALVLAVVVVVCDVGWLVFGWSAPGVGVMPVYASAPAAAALAVAVGPARLGLDSAGLRRWREFWVVALPSLAVAAAAFVWSGAGSVAEAGALVAASANEEVSYRVAVPVVLAALGARRWPRGAPTAALAVAAVWFALLPGHRAQMTSPAMAVIWVGMAWLFTLAVHRGGALVPAMVTHAAVNLWSFAVTYGDAPRGLHSVGTVLILAAVAAGAQLAGYRAGRLVPAGRPAGPAVPVGGSARPGPVGVGA